MTFELGYTLYKAVLKKTTAQPNIIFKKKKYLQLSFLFLFSPWQESPQCTRFNHFLLLISDTYASSDSMYPWWYKLIDIKSQFLDACTKLHRTRLSSFDVCPCMSIQYTVVIPIGLFYETSTHQLGVSVYEELCVILLFASQIEKKVTWLVEFALFLWHF